VVVRGSGIETEENVGRVADRFATALERDLSEAHGADAAYSFNRRPNTFEIRIDFEIRPGSGDGAGDGDGEDEG